MALPMEDGFWERKIGILVFCCMTHDKRRLVFIYNKIHSDELDDHHSFPVFKPEDSMRQNESTLRRRISLLYDRVVGS